MEIGLGTAGSYTDAVEQSTADVVAEETVTKPVETDTPAALTEPLAEPPAPAPVPETPAPAPDLVKAVTQQDNSAATLAAAKPEPEPESEPAQEPPKETKQETQETPAATPPEPQSAQPAAAAQRATGTDSDRSAGGKTGDNKSYFAELMAWLNKHKSYPRDAKKEKQQGVVELQFTLQRDGSVTASSIKKSSGHALLDNAALAMLAAAAPLPALPESMDRQQITLVIPIEFSLITNNRYKE
jgi:protein TonB